MEEQDDVELDSSTNEDVDSESSTEDLEEPTSEKGGQEQSDRIPYDRFKEVADEKNYWRDQYLGAVNKSQEPQVPKESGVDSLIANLPAEQRLFMQEWSNAQKNEFKRMLDEKEGDYRSTIEALASQNAKIQEKLFRQEQADVRPGSQEENEIASLIRAGIDPDKAAWAVMGPKRVEAAKSGKKTQSKEKTQMKAKANLETGGIPSNSGIPTGEKLSYREDLNRRMKEAGL